MTRVKTSDRGHLRATDEIDLVVDGGDRPVMEP
jgi:hypothetical protein